jgi:hypothetical protein
LTKLALDREEKPFHGADLERAIVHERKSCFRGMRSKQLSCYGATVYLDELFKPNEARFVHLEARNDLIVTN